MGEGGRCHNATSVTCRSREAKSQVSPSGASTEAALRLGAIIGSSNLNSVQLSLSIFILFLIRLVITIPQRHWQTPTTVLQFNAAKWPLFSIWTLQNTVKTRKVSPQRNYLKGDCWTFCQVNKDFCKQVIWSKISFHQCLILHRRLVITHSLPSGIRARLCPFYASAKAGSSFFHGELL